MAVRLALHKRVILVLVGFLVVYNIASSLRSIARDVPVVADMEFLPTIIIDPGHGGLDGGAVGVDGIVEKDINLAISMTMQDMFKASGFQVIMTRDTDVSIHDQGITGTRKQKSSDLRNRLAMVESHPNALFISVHQNKFGSASSHGAQMFFSPNDPQSQRLALILQDNMAAALQPDNTRQIKKAGKDLFLMYNAKCPAVLMECGFLSNSQEAHMLVDSDYQNKIAFVAFASVLEYLEMEPPNGAVLR